MANSRWREGADSGSGGQFWKTARPRLRWEPWGCGRLLSLSPSLSVARALCRESKWFLSSPSPNPHTQHIWNESTVKGGQAKPIHTLFATWSKLLHKALLLKASARYSSSVTIVTLQILDTDIDDGEGDHLQPDDPGGSGDSVGAQCGQWWLETQGDPGHRADQGQGGQQGGQALWWVLWPRLLLKTDFSCNMVSYVPCTMYIVHSKAERCKDV